MQPTIRALLVLSLMTTPAHAESADGEPPPLPSTRRDDVRETLHGVELVDPYRWLEDQDSPETRAWIAAQEAHCRAVLDARPERSAMLAALAPIYHRDDCSVPTERRGRLFFTKRLAGEQLASICVRDGLRGIDRVLVDPKALSPDGKLSAQIEAVDDDGARVAVAVRAGGADEAELRFLDAATGKEIAERLPSARYGSFLFTKDPGRVFYTVHADGVSTVREHRFGSPGPDPVLFGTGLPPGAGVGVDMTPDGKWLVVTTWHGSAALKSEIHVRPTESSEPFRAIVDDLDARFDPMPADGVLYVRSTWQAPRGRILAVDLANPGREHWKEIVPQSRHPLQDASLSGGRICARYLENVRPVIRVFSPEGTLERVIEAREIGQMTNVDGRWQDAGAWLWSSSWTEPEVIERVRVGDGARTEWFRATSPLPSSRFVVEQHEYVSTDGARVPIFLAHSRNVTADGTNAVLVTGYGGFGISQLPGFSPRMAAWLSLGGVVALPCLRGGAEFGEEWHEQAMGSRKQQTFDDLQRAAEWLVESRWAAPGRLALSGRSNGGLLVGAAITQHPETWRAAICGYPLLDMVRFHRFLIARFWVPEYGSSEDEEQFRTLLAYSPYHHVTQGTKYPAMLFVTGDADTRVAPLHARKMAALLQASTSSGLPVLLHYDSEMGHLGGLPADKEMADMADETAFLAWQLGLPVGLARDRARNPPR